jgi:FMN-dependent oxidoreductase (nitrilotriacetate monooxygenase family)
MSALKRQMNLNLFLMSVGHHEAAWRHPDTHPERITDIRYYQELAQIAERAKLDSIFLADGLATWGRAAHSVIGGLEPFTFLSAVGAVTERIGLIGTVSTTYNEPFHVARKFASLDHISNGRAGWNIVTSGGEMEALNFSKEEHLEHAQRYRRAQEFLEVTTSLWDSWDDDARIADKKSGRYADPDKVRSIDHRGEWFSVKGPLNVPRPPQGYPLLVQAGSSEDGRAFAARNAEAIFTAQQTLEDAQEFYSDVKSRAARYGRNPDYLKILPGIGATIGATEAEAKEKEEFLHSFINFERGAGMLAYFLKQDVSTIDLDGPVPPFPPVEQVNGMKSRSQLIDELARRENLTVRQLIRRLAGGRGHRTFAGTAVQVADQLEEWFTQGAADGFNIMPPILPDGLHDFVNLVVPELQRRGLFRTEYTGTTLREHYGLPRPENRFLRPAPATPEGISEEALAATPS